MTVRVPFLLVLVSLFCFGCNEANEPLTRPDDLPRLGVTATDEAADNEAPPAERAPDPVVAPPGQRTGSDQQAPATYTVRLDTTKGPILIDITRAWSPRGADRFYTLVRSGYYTDVAFFRVIAGFMAQVGLHGDPAMNRQWRARRIQDDPPVGQSNTRGMISYAMAGPGSRTTQFFINLVDNARLDSMGFTPFARVQPASMAVVDQLHSGYGEGAPRGRGPAQGRIQNEGNTYLRAEFPNLDYIRSATIVE